MKAGRWIMSRNIIIVSVCLTILWSSVFIWYLQLISKYNDIIIGKPGYLNQYINQGVVWTTKKMVHFRVGTWHFSLALSSPSLHSLLCTSTPLYVLIIWKETLPLCNSLAVFLNIALRGILLVNVNVFFYRFGVACSQALCRYQCLYTHHLSRSILKIRALTSRSSRSTIHMTFQSDLGVSTNPVESITLHHFHDVEWFI
jgi:hypothetical protein